MKQLILSFKTIFIPVHNGNHWFLIVYNGQELISLDPYNYPGTDERERQKLMGKNELFHKNILSNLKTNYFEPLFQKYNKQWQDLDLRVKLPPEIPAQENNHDCGVFLLMFAKCILMKLDFDFNTEDMIQIRDVIRQEINTGKTLENIPYVTPRKRKGRKHDSTTKKVKKSNSIQCPQRRIINPDAETCWLNSCLQLILTALDFYEEMPQSGSIMWQNLIQLQGIDTTLPLDPSGVKRVMLLTEKSHTLFNLGNLPVLYNEDLRIGQQDCREFFYCINENRESWPDVFNLFKVSTLSETECCNCGNISRQEVSANERTLISLPCPTSTVNMKDYLECQLNGFQLVENWRDENGCGEIVNGRSKTQISNISETDYVVFMLERLLEFDGQLQIMKTKVIVNPQEKVNLIDIDGRTGKFLPLAIIHHSGGIIEQTTYGHYQADVINKVTFSC